MEKKKIGAGILMVDLSSGKILLGRRDLNSSNPNTWSIFGGTYDEKDGHPKETAKREFREETKIDIPYQISTVPIHIYNDNQITFYTYAGLVNSQFQVKLSDESLGYGWFELDTLPKNLLPGFLITLNEKHDLIKNIIDKHKKLIQ